MYLGSQQKTAVPDLPAESPMVGVTREIAGCTVDQQPSTRHTRSFPCDSCEKPAGHARAWLIGIRGEPLVRMGMQTNGELQRCCRRTTPTVQAEGSRPLETAADETHGHGCEGKFVYDRQTISICKLSSLGSWGRGRKGTRSDVARGRRRQQ